VDTLLSTKSEGTSGVDALVEDSAPAEGADDSPVLVAPFAPESPAGADDSPVLVAPFAPESPAGDSPVLVALGVGSQYSIKDICEKSSIQKNTWDTTITICKTQEKTFLIISIFKMNQVLGPNTLCKGKLTKA